MSKVGINALSFAQQNLFNNDDSRQDIVVSAVHPGYVDTDMTNHQGHLTPDKGIFRNKGFFFNLKGRKL
jgi:carbonyl reductase 1